MSVVLVFGGNGMLGHKLCQVLADQHQVWATVRSDKAARRLAFVHPADRILRGVSTDNPESVAAALCHSGAGVVINAVGVLKRGDAASDPVRAIAINSLFPQQLAAACRERGVRLVHVSTDCVFSGTRGRYRIEDLPDATDLYGRSKLLGEVLCPGALTLRTSIIGRELAGAGGLFEWFLSHRGGRIPGFSNAVFSGFTTLVLARLIDTIIREHPDLEGLWHASADPIDKHDLLQRIETRIQSGTTIWEDPSVRIDRSLDSTPLRDRLAWRPPSWDEQLDGLVADTTPYEALRRDGAA
jgi:dTDP-4-dehydrorhamnose reductase